MHFPPAELVTTLADGTKVKRRTLRMRACDETNEKGKHCTGHLKRFFHAPAELGGEVYRCERCKTLYLPNATEPARTLTLAY
jgi:hypothetical protein